MPLIIQTAADGTPIGVQIIKQRDDPHPQGDTPYRNYLSFSTALFPLATTLRNAAELNKILENEEGLSRNEQLKKLVALADSIGLDVRLVGPNNAVADVPPKPHELIVVFRDP